MAKKNKPTALPHAYMCTGSIIKGDGCQTCLQCLSEAKAVVQAYKKTPLNQIPVEIKPYFRLCCLVLVLKFDHIWFADFIKGGK